MLEEIGALYRGMVIGLAIAAPIGPVGLLCIRRTLQKGWVFGLATGLGAALGDAVFGAIAVLGVSAVLDFIHHHAPIIRVIGGLAVLISAWNSWRDRPQKPSLCPLPNGPPDRQDGAFVGNLLREISSAFIITLTNPLTLFATLAIVATFGGLTSGLESDVMIGGIFSGSALWWVLLSGGVSLLRGYCTDDRIRLVNRVTAICLAALGLWAIASGIKGFL